MSTKVVLVSYMERNKKFTIPTSKEQSDVEFLKKEFFTAFGFRRMQDHTVTFQSFDEEFGEFVETEDDALFANKTKLKAILVRQSETNSKLWHAEIESSRSTSELQSFTSSPTSAIRAWSPSVSDIETRASSPSVSDIQIRATSPSTSASISASTSASTSFIPVSQENECLLKRKSTSIDAEVEDDSGISVIGSGTKKKKIIKPNELPLPDPFPLPQNFRPDVELALKSGNMTANTRKAYLSQVASAIFGFKKYPSREEFMRVAYQITRMYPFLQSPLPNGSKIGAIVQTLCDRFKELRRPIRTTVTQRTEHRPKKQMDFKAQTSAMAILCKPPALPPGEDETSLNRHIKALCTEYTKTNKGRGNHQLVTSLMEKTFSVRRADVLKSEEFNLNMILTKYPYLQCSDHLFMEMERILAGAGSDVTHASFSDSWNKLWTPRIMTQARSESSSNTRLRNVLESTEISSESNASLPVYGLVLLPYMLRDSRFVPDYKRVLHCIPASSNVEQEIEQKKQNEPYLMCCGGVIKPEQVYLVIDCEVVCEVEPYHSVFALLCGFFVFNVQYTTGCKSMFSFLESLLHLQCKQTRQPSVALFMAALTSLNTKTV